MKKIILFITAVWLCAAGNLIAVNTQEDDETPREFVVKGVAGGVSGAVEDKGNTSDAVLKEKIISTGALEKVEGDKYTLRKVQTRIEFYLQEGVKIYLKSDGGPVNLTEKSYIDIRGPKNKKAVLANAIYIYDNKKMYDEMTDKDALPAKKSFQAPLTGIVIQKNPLLGKNENGDVTQKYSFIIKGDDGVEYQVCFDEDTLWVNNTSATKSDMIAGDRMKLFFEKWLSIRYKNHPVKIIIDKSKNVF
jgi:hypothetical protein